MGRKLGIDFGLKRTGIALTDETNMIASPHETVDSHLLMNYLKEIVVKYHVDTLVLGEPKRLDGTDTHISENVRLLKTALESVFVDIPVVLIDERFTSGMAFQTILAVGANKKQRQSKALVDKVSAAIILQSYLDRHIPDQS
ncbi:MAG: Holliday junction resolvase RuvX [Bacteroidota bacterium]|jgi:putative Holliday junction resolvase